MPGVQRFIDQRQQARPDSRRQSLGHLHKVPVPATKLQHTEQREPAQKPDKSAVTILSSSKQVAHHSELQSAQTSNDHGDGFDTDAEGLDDTTFTIAEYESKNQQGDEDCIGHGSHLPFRATDQSRRNEQNPVQLAPDDLAVDGDDESYDESGEGESDNEEAEEDDQYEESILPNVMQELNSPGYAQFRQQRTTFSKEAAFQQIEDSPPTRNFGFTNPAMTYVGNQSSRTTNPFQTRGHSAGDHSAGSGADTRGQDQRGAPPGKNQILSFIPQQQSNGPAKQPSNRNPPLTLLGTVTATCPITHHQSTALLESPLSKPQSRNAQVGTKLDDCTANVSIFLEGENNMMPPKIYAPNTGETVNLQKRLEAGMQPNANPEAMLVSNEFAGLGGDEFSAGEGHDLDETFEARSVASVENGKTRKRGRSIDYGLDELAGMNFNHLTAEPFHIGPQPKEVVLPPQIASGTLAEKLDYLVRLENHEAKVSQQRSFLASLPMGEYEECGDIMVERFSEFVKTFKHARQQRRRIAKEFEEEVAKREERVRGKIDAFEKDLSRLKTGGEDVVRKKLAL